MLIVGLGGFVKPSASANGAAWRAAILDNMCSTGRADADRAFVALIYISASGYLARTGRTARSTLEARFGCTGPIERAFAEFIICRCGRIGSVGGLAAFEEAHGHRTGRGVVSSVRFGRGLKEVRLWRGRGNGAGSRQVRQLMSWVYLGDLIRVTGSHQGLLT